MLKMKYAYMNDVRKKKFENAELAIVLKNPINY